MGYLNAVDVVNGGEGSAYAKIDGNNEELFFARNLKATAKKHKAQVTPIGARMVGHKSGKVEITGSMTLYYMSPLFRKLMSDYKESGKDVYFDMVVENNDPASAAGRQTVLLTGVNLDSALLTQLDGDADDPLEENVTFTAEDYRILNAFAAL